MELLNARARTLSNWKTVSLAPTILARVCVCACMCMCAYTCWEGLYKALSKYKRDEAKRKQRREKSKQLRTPRTMQNLLDLQYLSTLPLLNPSVPSRENRGESPKSIHILRIKGQGWIFGWVFSLGWWQTLSESKKNRELFLFSIQGLLRDAGGPSRRPTVHLKDDSSVDWGGVNAASSEARIHTPWLIWMHDWSLPASHVCIQSSEFFCNNN